MTKTFRTKLPHTFIGWMAAAIVLGAVFSVRSDEAETSESAPPLPQIVKLDIFPAEVTLASERDIRSVIVTGSDEQGLSYDVTHAVQLSMAGDHAEIDADGFLVPKQAGQTELIAKYEALEARVPVTVKSFESEPVSFVREVLPAMSKVGCNAGTCHGSQKGKNGFKLSLRGYDPLFDYRALTDDVSGRRFNRSQPSQSLMLLKPTQGVPHEGGFLFDEQSRYYQLIERWIAEGCRYEDIRRVERLEVFPNKPLLQDTTNQQQLLVLAHFADGTNRDVTREAVYETSNFEVLTVSQTGLIQGVRRGEAAALVRYEGLYGVAPSTVIGSREGFEWKPSPEFNFVDTHVNRKLERSKILPSELCTDEEFLRRVSLDLTGLPPAPEQLKAFLEDKRDSEAKRSAKIEDLIASPEFVDHWTLKWSDLLMANRKFIKEKGVWAFRNWIRNSIATNQPYDQFVYELMTANGSTYENPAANYYRIAREPREVMENMTQVFLGTRFQCNQCHDHPFERWTQQQYYELSAYFAAVGRKPGVLPDEEIIYTLRNPQPVLNPDTNQTVSAAAFPFDVEGNIDSSAHQRKQLAQWLTSPENPYFAKSLVNRYWSYFTGRGIIDPVDDIRASNPPSNPELLEALTEDFVAHGWDLKHLVRTIVRSHTYQRSYKSNEWNESDTVNFSHAIPRRLSAEELFDAILIATGAPANLPGMPAGFRASQLPDPNVKVDFLDMFGRAPRESPCECERSSEVSLAQTLNLVNGPTVANSIVHPQGRIAKALANNASEEELVETVYLGVLCRHPSEDELQNSLLYMKNVGKSDEAAQDLMWALINSPSFLFNR
jgi:hypothetical protein